MKLGLIHLRCIFYGFVEHLKSLKGFIMIKVSKNQEEEEGHITYCFKDTNPNDTADKKYCIILLLITVVNGLLKLTLK